jgi:hypothetical protein
LDRNRVLGADSSKDTHVIQFPIGYLKSKSPTLCVEFDDDDNDAPPVNKDQDDRPGGGKAT